MDDIEEEESPPTAMELAIKAAFDQQENEEGNRGKVAKEGKQKPSQSEQNDIITRTLRSHGD